MTVPSEFYYHSHTGNTITPIAGVAVVATSTIPNLFRLPHKLYVEFACRTRVHLSKLLTTLSATTTDLNAHASIVMPALSVVVKVEQEMNVRFEVCVYAASFTTSYKLFLWDSKCFLGCIHGNRGYCIRRRASISIAAGKTYQ